MKTVCIYHSIDLDGWMSAAIVKYWFNKTIEPKNVVKSMTYLLDTLTFIGYNYGQPIPDLSEYDKVIMCDISFPVEEMEKIASKLIWIDHHISAINIMDTSVEFNSNVVTRFTQTNYAACELTWVNFFPNEDIPEIVRLLGRYDCFGHKGTDEEQKILEFQYGARQCISNYEEAYYNLTSIDRPLVALSLVENIHMRGKTIYQYLCTEAKQDYKNGFAIKFMIPHPDYVGEGQYKLLKFVCINKERFNPINFGIDYHKDGYDGCACFHYANGCWNFSLYNDNGLVDCSQIAEQFGGGGHKGAAGFRVDNETFLKIISSKS